jgi:hypothetical protein
VYQIYNVVEPPETNDLMTVDQLRVLLNMSEGSSTAPNEQIQAVITDTSAAMAKRVNRVFGYQKVHETFYEVEGVKRLYFSKSWPVKFEDIELLTHNGVDMLPDLELVLEESTGTLYLPWGLWTGTVDCVYWGGYKLPDEAPEDLQRAASAVMTESYYTFQRGMLATGVRMLSHKGARIQFQQPTMGGTTPGAGAGGTPAWQAAMNTLDHYFRHWI